MRTALLAFVIVFSPYLARADTPPVPDISGWVNISTSRIEVRMSESKIAYLGLEAVYYNPSNHREFIKVISRHVPIVFVKPKVENNRLFNEVAMSLYANKEEKDRLEELARKTDHILYIHWRIRDDSLDGRGMREGDVDIWLLGPDGVYRFFQNERVAIQFLTENVGNGAQRNVLAGRKYQVSDTYQLLKVARQDLVRVTERKK